ncbi:MAG: CPBP family intramembrane metalloprotease [Acidobacteria bacterium]|nr:CPBP family intramembrane metalloprotease [Acidobacteriota bacterium]
MHSPAATPRTSPAQGALLEGIIVTIIVVLLVRFLVRQGPWAASLSPAIWLNLPLLVLWIRHLPFSEHGFSFASWRVGGRWLFVSIVLVLIPFFVLVISWRWINEQGLLIAWDRLTLQIITYHLLYHAIPEELFFRGYLQQRVASWAKSIGQVHLGLPIFLSALLFAIAHLLVSPGWQRAAVFLPGLAMAWLRQRTGGLLAPAGFHWLANLIAAVLVV